MARGALAAMALVLAGCAAPMCRKLLLLSQLGSPAELPGNYDRGPAHAGVVRIVRGVDHAERRTRLPTGNAGILPAAQEGVRPPWRFEERQIVYVADIQHVPDVEARTSPVTLGSQELTNPES